jgi:hypothetical protein
MQQLTIIIIMLKYVLDQANNIPIFFVFVFCVLYLSDATSEAEHAYPCAAPDATTAFWLLCLAKLTRNFILGIKIVSCS